jgi:hypothetical protein
MCVTRELVVFVDNLLRRTAHFTFGARTVEHLVNDVATAVIVIGTAVATIFRTRARSRRFHKYNSAFVPSVVITFRLITECALWVKKIGSATVGHKAARDRSVDHPPLQQD